MCMRVIRSGQQCKSITWDNVKPRLDVELVTAFLGWARQPRHRPPSGLTVDSQYVDIGNELIASLNSIIINNCFHLLLTVEGDAGILRIRVLFRSNMKLTSSDEQVLALQMSVGLVIERQLSVDSYQLVYWR